MDVLTKVLHKSMVFQNLLFSNGLKNLAMNTRKNQMPILPF